MYTLLMVSAIGLLEMIAVMAYFADDIAQEQREIKNNFIKKRKMNLYKLSLNNDAAKELIRTTKKSFFVRQKEKIEKLIFKADIKITYTEYLMMCILCAVIGWMIGESLNNFLISVVLAYVSSRLPKMYLDFVGANLKKQIDEQLEPAISQIIGLLPTKKTLINACEACVEGMDQPLKNYFNEFINNINNANRSFEESLNELARKIDSKPFYDFARLAVVHYKHGGETMYAFSSIPESIRDIKLIQSEQETELDSLRMMGYMFVLIAPLCYGYYYISDRASFDILINTGIGKGISFIVLLISLITIKLINKISKPVQL